MTDAARPADQPCACGDPRTLHGGGTGPCAALSDRAGWSKNISCPCTAYRADPTQPVLDPRCTRCNRVIPEDESIASGMHWECYERGHEERMKAMAAEAASLLLAPLDPRCQVCRLSTTERTVFSAEHGGQMHPGCVTEGQG